MRTRDLGLRLSRVEATDLSRNGETVARGLFPHLRDVRHDAPDGELSQFSALAVANQYRLAYALSRKFAPPGSTVLDWGCGDGHFSYFLLASGYEVVSYSLQHQPRVLNTLSTELSKGFRYVQGNPADPTRLPFADGSFDAVFSVGVLEHVRETGGSELGSLRELRRVLRPNGHFLCFHLPNRYSYIEALARVVRRRSGPDDHGYHQFRFSVRDIHDICGKAGFAISLQGRYAFLPRNMLGRLPEKIRDSASVIRAINGADDVFARALPVFCQNHFFVARPV